MKFNFTFVEGYYIIFLTYLKMRTTKMLPFFSKIDENAILQKWVVLVIGKKSCTLNKKK